MRTDPTDLLPSPPAERPLGPVARCVATRVARYDALALRVERATPPVRDRLVDAVRVAAMFAVVLGHWLMASVTVDAEGTVDGVNVLAALPATQWLTLALQVMGLFFAVAGWSSAATLVGRRGSGPVVDPAGAATRSWVAARLSRVVAPTAVYVAVVGVALPVLGLVVGDATAAAGRLVAVQLWFVAVLVLLVVATPWLWVLWSRVGWAAPAAATATALLVDVLHRVVEVPGVGWANFLLVWSVPTFLGFAWHDGRLAARRTQVALALGGAVALAALVATPWLPLSMVGVDGAGQSNNAPPSTALVALTCLHLGLLLLAAPRLRALLARPRVWAPVALAGRFAMTVYLWHLLGVVVVVGAMLALGGLGQPTLGTVGWWLSRPLWVLALAAGAAPLVALAVRAEHAPTRLRAGAPGWPRVLLGVVLVTWAAEALVRGGLLGGPAALGGAHPAVAVLLLGAGLLRALPTRRAGAVEQPRAARLSRS